MAVQAPSHACPSLCVSLKPGPATADDRTKPWLGHVDKRTHSELRYHPQNCGDLAKVVYYETFRMRRET